MDALSQRIDALESLGDYFSNFDENNPEYYPFVKAIEQATIENGWFRREECIHTISCWGKALEKLNIENWLAPYALTENQSTKTIALVLAGNLPMVGFHDILAVWITGNTALIKCASKDKVLIPFIINNNPRLKSMSLFTEEKLKNFDAVIATGSNNSARYFDYYFAKYPSLIRKNRNGVAILNGKETKSELENLGMDILQYFGLGCRNVAKLYLPKGFDLNRIFSALPIVALILILTEAGALLIEALARSNDQQLAGAIIFLLTATIVFVNFVTDIILAIMDPRIRKGVMGGN